MSALTEPTEEGVSWYSSGINFASPQENIVAALALVYHATSTGGEELVKKHMAEIATTPPMVHGSRRPLRTSGTSWTRRGTGWSRLFPKTRKALSLLLYTWREIPPTFLPPHRSTHGGRHDGPSQTDIKKRVRESSDMIELMCAIASLKAKSTPPRCPPA